VYLSKIADSATEQPASNSRVTAVPRRSWKCSPVPPAARAVLIQTLRNAPAVHGRPRGPVKMIGPRRGALSSTRRRGESLPVGRALMHREREGPYLTGTARDAMLAALQDFAPPARLATFFICSINATR
jgi:hypothetical protein